jgi:hypothetical protein
MAISAFALGILERDGLAACLGWITAAGSLLLLAAISSAIVAGIAAFFNQLWLLFRVLEHRAQRWTRFCGNTMRRKKSESIGR